MIAPAFHLVRFKVFFFSRRRVNKTTLSVLTTSVTNAETSILRGIQGPSFQYIILLENKMERKPAPSGVNKPSLDGPGRDPGVGVARTGTGVGKVVAVLVAVNDSAPINVTVGVKVSGVLVEVAKRFCVGVDVRIGAGVGVSAGGGEVGVAINCGRLILGKPEQLPRNKLRARIWISFFMMRPFEIQAFTTETLSHGVFFIFSQCLREAYL
jgi:hypothetical protein